MAKDKKEEYLKQLKEIERRGKFRATRKIYKRHRKDLTEHGFYLSPHVLRHKDKYSHGKKLLKASNVNSAETAALAYSLMKNGIERGDIKYSLLGAQLYEKIGRGRKAISRLLKTAEKNIEIGKSHKLGDAYSKIENFVRRNTEEREQGEGSLEKKFGIFAAFIIGGIALSLGSLVITGNAVSNLTQTTPGLLGIFLFIAGLVGVFFCSRRK
jgi:hypothetical protein